MQKRVWHPRSFTTLPLLCGMGLFVSGALSGQVSEEWVARYAGPGTEWDASIAVAVDGLGGVCVTGTSWGPGTLNDYLTVKYDAGGRQLWAARFDGGGNTGDEAKGLAADGGGNVYVTGRSSGMGTSWDFATIKYDAAGNEVWVARYDGFGVGGDYPSAVAVDAAGNVYVTGLSSVENVQGIVTIKYGPEGEQRWLARYEGPVATEAVPSAVKVDGEGNVYVGGWADVAPGDRAYVTIKYDSRGSQLWAAFYEGLPGEGYTDEVAALAVDGAGNVYVTGRSVGPSGGGGGPQHDCATIKYDSNGSELWVARYNGPPGTGEDAGIALALDGVGGVYVAARTGVGGYWSYGTIKYDSEGNQEWVALYAPPGEHALPTAMGLDAGGNAYVTGGVRISEFENQFATVKYDGLGNELWVAVYNIPGDDEDFSAGLALAVDGAGSVYVTGASSPGLTAPDYATVKYDSEGNERWVARYNAPGAGEDAATDLAVQGAGDVAVTGWSWNGMDSHDYATVLYDSEGREAWVARYQGPAEGYDAALSVGIDGTGNVTVTGESEGVGTGSDYATVQYDAQGLERWVARYNGPGSGEDEAAALAVDGDRNVYVSGSSWGSGTSFDYATLKYDSEGDRVWLARYDGGSGQEDRASAIGVDGEGNVCVTGWSYGISSRDFATVKYDAAGNEVWVARYDGPSGGDDQAFALAVDGEGNVYVAGRSDGIGGSLDFATIKYDAVGNELWVRRYDGPAAGYDAALAIAVDGAGNVYVTGPSDGLETSTDFATVAYDSQGNELWVARYDGGASGYDASWSLAVDGNGGVYVAGQSLGSDLTADYATVKYDASGTEVWVARYDGPGDAEGPPDDNPAALALDASGGVYVTGQDIGLGTSGDFATVKYQQQPVGISSPGPGGPQVPRASLLGPNYPNPFNPSTLIRYSIPGDPSGGLGASGGVPGEVTDSGPAKTGSGVQVTLSVFNIRGQKVATLVRERQGPGDYSVLWDGTSDSGAPVPSGVYFYRLEPGGFTATRKMLLSK